MDMINEPQTIPAEFRGAQVRIMRPTFDSPWGYGLHIGGPHTFSKRWVVSNIEIAVIDDEPGRIYPNSGPVLQLESNQAQVLMDDLWNCGVRPTEGSGSAGSFAAQGAHLKDLRKILGRQIGLDL